MISLTQRQPISQPASVAGTSAEDQPLTETAALSESVIGFFLSVLLHTLLLLFLALFVYAPTRATQQTEILNAQIEPLPEAEAITPAEVSLDNLLDAADDTDSSQLQEDARQLANASEPPPVTAAFFSNQGMVPAARPGSGNGWGGDAIAGLGETVGALEVAGNGSRETGDGEVGFFGTKAKGKSFVFIVDCSGSMTQPTSRKHPRLNVLVSRFMRARQELYLSLAQLSKDQSFYIIFYNHETYPMFFPRSVQSLLSANPDMLGLARTWIQKVEAGGGTDPREAFQLALALRPQVIFFLTDGAIPPATRMVAKEHNQSRTRIHTIAFGIQNHQEILKGIAADNQGRFRFVP